MSEVRLAAVISHPTQHFVPLYVELAKKNNIKLKVFYIAENGIKATYDQQFGVQVKWNTPMLEGYEYEFVEPGKVVDDFGFFSVDSKELTKTLSEFNPNWLWLHGYSQRANWRALMAKKAHTKVLYSSDSNFGIKPKKTYRSFYKKLIKRIAVRLFFKKINIFLSISPANKQYLINYGVDESQIIDSAFPVDIDRLSQQRSALNEKSVERLKQDLSIEEKAKVIIVVGKLIPRKRVADVVDALSKLKDQTIHLIVVGSGECQAQLVAQSVKRQLTNRVHFTGFVNQAELPRYLAAADIFVMPSEDEPYGAVVAEALPFALPIVIARAVGAVGASAIEKKNALLFNVGEVGDLVVQLDFLLSNSELMLSFSKQSLLMSCEHNKDVMASHIAQVCNDKSH